MPRRPVRFRLVALLGLAVSCSDSAIDSNRAPTVAQVQIVTLPGRSSEHPVMAADADDDSLSFSLDGASAFGELSLSDEPPTRLRFVAGERLGRDAVTLVVEDGRGGRAEAAVDIRVVEDRPIADPQTVALDEDTSTTLQLVGLDPRGTPVEFLIRERPDNGRLEAIAPNTSGRFTYEPAGEYSGPDRFTFEVRDPDDTRRRSEPAEVLITVRPVNDAPTTVNQSFSTLEDTALDDELSAFDADADALAFELVAGPRNGSVRLESSGTFHYEPAPDFDGRDRFTFRVFDGSLSSMVATATISMRAVNDAPVVLSDGVNTPADTPILIQLQVTDVESDPTVSRVSFPPANGTAEVVDPVRGLVLYRPKAGFIGTDAFRVRASDDVLVSAEATIEVSVTTRAGPIVAPGLPDPTYGATSDGLFALSPDLASSFGRSVIGSTGGGLFLLGDTVTGLRRRPTIFEVDAAGNLVTNSWSRGFVRAMSSVNGDIASFALDAQGRILVATLAPTYGDRHPVLVQRLLPSGALDSSFAFGGEARLSISAGEQPMYLGVDAEDRIILAATSPNSDDATLHVLRLLEDGNLDPDFRDLAGNESHYQIELELTGKAENQVRGLHVRSDGRVLIANEARTGSFISNMETQIIEVEAGGAPVVRERLFLLDHTDGMVVGPNGLIHVSGHTGLANAVLARVDLTTNTSTTMDLEARCGTPRSVRRFLAVDDGGATLVVHQGGDGGLGFCRIEASADTDSEFADRGTLATAANLGQPDAELRGLDYVAGAWFLTGTTRRPTGTFSDWTVVKLDSSGALAPGFGDTGTLRIHEGSGNDIVFGFDLQGDGRALVLARSEESVLFSQQRRLSVFRVTAGGEPDPAFAGGAATPVPFPHDATYPSGNIRADGVGGAYVLAARDGGGVALARFTPGGVVDVGFGTSGVLGPLNVDSRFLLRDGSGRLLMFSSNGRALLRFSASGAADGSFGTDGMATFISDPGSNLDIEDVAVHSDGRIAAVFSGPSQTGRELRVITLDANGELNGSFGNAGGFSETILGLPAWSHAKLRFDPQGRIVVAVYAELNDEAEHRVFRLTASGSLDSSFGAGGRFIDPGPAASTTHLAVDARGRVLFSVFTTAGSSIRRLGGTGELDESFGAGGTSPVLVREPGSVALRVGELSIGDGIHALSVGPDGESPFVAGTLDGEALVRRLLP